MDNENDFNEKSIIKFTHLVLKLTKIKNYSSVREL